MGEKAHKGTVLFVTVTVDVHYMDVVLMAAGTWAKVEPVNTCMHILFLLCER